MVDVAMNQSVRSQLSGDSISVVVDRVGNEERIFIPLSGKIGKNTALSGQILPIILSPINWKISCGTFAGHIESISLHEATIPTGDGLGFYQMRRFWQNFPRFWAFDRTNESNVEFTTADSLAQERTWTRLEGYFCEKLAKPGTYAQVLENGGWFLRVNTNHPVIGNAGTGSNSPNSPYLFWGGTTLRDRNDLDSGLQEHELLHTLGFGHTCSWFSVMFTNCNHFGSDNVTPSDVAYIKLFYAVRKLEVDRSAVLGLDASIKGEREIILGLPSSLISSSDMQEIAHSPSEDGWMWTHKHEH
jgi:hypothetical protein